MADNIKLYYWNGELNAGDIFSSFILDSMGVPFEFSDTPDIGITGSILSDYRFDGDAYIWGLGFGNPDEAVYRKNVCAVRGKLTQQLLGVECAVGDPGILASKFYHNTTSKKYKFGIIPHYIDYEFFSQQDKCRIIDIRTSNFIELFNAINECEVILSSSLHGLIFALSYGIPAIHIKHNELLSRDSFKFRDFYSCLSIPYSMISVQDISNFNAIDFDGLYKRRDDYNISDAEINAIQTSLLDCFPYK